MASPSAVCYANEGSDLDRSTLADQVEPYAAALAPIHALIQIHVLGAEQLHSDDTTLPLLAKDGTRKARLWTYVWDDRALVEDAPRANPFHFAQDRAMFRPNRHPAGGQRIVQAGAYTVTTTSIAKTLI
jgi:hypothetical protein